ncbi:conserved Plasmodium protein, unknown function [Plasmodium sp. gorilla clade G2]|uniref:conserved Plasmodium protein, unknown function n=1 Tax=Plasmodium sp. gorilla clade G2 TaxID=880535 RepID=UPI000D2085D8|nr:conserved Plasmodium protein, unknown function [Plasmodium sp. gorilla clade G2]SOV17062.1 conserved Plasmodium protein, unknown function [Plasmodium sp. gorilla clade G2]
MKVTCALRVLFSVFFLFFWMHINIVRSDNVCKGADVIINDFWNKLNNIRHGEVILINIKNYYCPACNRYMNIWNDVEKKILTYEKNVSLFVFDCSCYLLVPYCRYFDVLFFPTFRLLFPVYDKMNENEYKYINPSSMIEGEKYSGELLLAYREVERLDNMYDFKTLIEKYLCKNVNFNYNDLRICMNSSYIYPEKKNKKKNEIYQFLFGDNNEKNKKEIKDDVKVMIDDFKDNNNNNNNNDNYYYDDDNDDDDDDVENKENVERWSNQMNLNNDNIKHDIIIGILFTLKKHISLGRDIEKEYIQPFIVMLSIVSNIYNDLEEGLYDIINKLNSFKYPIKYDQWIKYIENINYINEYKLEYNNKDTNLISFKLCEPNSVLCSYWLLYHKISVYCLQEDEYNYSYYLQVITDYTKNYLNCQNCIDHFINAQKFCYYGYCNIHSAESFVIFLWRIHNAVTLRSMYDLIIIDNNTLTHSNNFNKKKFINKDIVFPTLKQCKNCRNALGFTKISNHTLNTFKNGSFNDQSFDAIDAFNVKKVLQYLIQIYS